MQAAAAEVAILEFAAWHGATFAAASGIACRIGWKDEEWWAGLLAVQIVLESSLAAAF